MRCDEQQLELEESFLYQEGHTATRPKKKQQMYEDYSTSSYTVAFLSIQEALKSTTNVHAKRIKTRLL